MAANSVLILAILVVASCAHAQKAPTSAPPGLGVSAPAPAAMAPADACADTLVSLASCLTYVETGSNLTKPEDECCSGLKTIVKTNPICLCALLGNNSDIGIPIDFTKSLGLPKVCKVKTPPVSSCPAANGSLTSSPTRSPGPMMPGMPGGGGMTPSMSPGMMGSPPAPGNGGRNTRELSLAAVVGLSSVAVAILF